MLTPRGKKSLLQEKTISPEGDRTHDAVLSRTAGPAHYQRAIPAPTKRLNQQCQASRFLNPLTYYTIKLTCTLTDTHTSAPFVRTKIPAKIKKMLFCNKTVRNNRTRWHSHEKFVCSFVGVFFLSFFPSLLFLSHFPCLFVCLFVES